MKVINIIRLDYKQVKKISFFLLCVLCFFPLFKIDFTSKVASLFFISSIVFNYKTGYEAIKKNSKKPLIINCLFFFALAFSVFYSSNLKEANTTLLRQISFLLFPFIIFYFIKIEKKELIILAKLFVLSNLLSLIFILYHVSKTDSILSIINTNFNFRSIIDNNASYKEWHPAYMSLFIVVSQFLIIKNIFNLKAFSQRFIHVLLFIVFSFFLFMLNSRSAIYSFILISPLFVFFQLKTKRKRLIFIISLIPIGLLLYYVLATKFTLYNRLVLQLENIYRWIVYDEVLNNSINSRYFINICSSQLFSESPYFGYGIGDIKYLLRNCYLDKEYNELYSLGLNTHNTYFYLLLSGGIVALLSFFTLVISNLVVSFKQNNYLYVSIIFTLLIVFLSENYFVRLNGILFFAAINTLLYYDMNLLALKNDNKK